MVRQGGGETGLFRLLSDSLQTLHLSFFVMVAASTERFALPALRSRPLAVQLIAQEVWAGLEVMYHYCSVSFSAECSQHPTANGGHQFVWKMFQAFCLEGSQPRFHLCGFRIFKIAVRRGELSLISLLGLNFASDICLLI